MNSFQRIASWLGRLALLASTVIFTIIGLRYLLDPVAASAELQTTFGSAAGIISMRVGFGAFPLAFAAILAVCLFSSRHTRFGLGMVATLMGTAAAARLYGLALDGPAAQSTRLLAPELVLLALSLSSLMGARRSARTGDAVARPEGRALDPREPGGPGVLRRRSGVVIVAFVAVALAASAIAKFAGVPAVVAQLEAAGFTRLVPLVATLELASAALVLFPPTRALGLAFASAFLGGAIATHLQHGLSPIPPALPLALLWLGMWLRHPELVAAGMRPVRPTTHSRALGAGH
jgi:hypothetical protein